MAVVTGRLNDFQLMPMPDLVPRIRFTASSAVVDAGRILVTAPIEVIPDATGAFTVQLSPLETARPAAYYVITVQWLDSAGQFIGMNEIPGRLFVPVEGGTISDLFVTEAGAPGMTWIALTPPPVGGPFTSWLRMDPLHTDDYSADIGDYMEWS